jgi:hypothetical protein
VFLKKIILPNLKTYLFSSDKETEKSNFVSIAVLDDPAEEGNSTEHIKYSWRQIQNWQKIALFGSSG